MNLKISNNFRLLLVTISLITQVTIVTGFIYLNNKIDGKVNTDALDKFINEEQSKSVGEINHRLLKLAYISKEARLSEQQFNNSYIRVVRHASKLLLLLIFIQIVLFISLMRSKKEDNHANALDSQS